MGVSKNSGFSPQIIHLIGFSITNHPFWGIPIFWKHPDGTLPETNSSHVKMDGWNTIVSFWDGLFSWAMVVVGSVVVGLPLNAVVASS